MKNVKMFVRRLYIDLWEIRVHILELMGNKVQGSFYVFADLNPPLDDILVQS